MFIRQEHNTLTVSQECWGKRGFQDVCTEWVQLNPKSENELNLIDTKKTNNNKEEEEEEKKMMMILVPELN